MARELDTIDNGLQHAGIRPQQVTDLRGGHILPLPAERVAQPVAEEPPALAVAPQRVAGAEVHVALLEDVPGHLLLGGGVVVPVPAEGPAEHAGARVDMDEDLAALVEGHAPREARAGVAEQLARLRVRGNGHVLIPEEPPLDGAVEAQRLGGEVAPAGVVQAQHHLGGVVELVDGLDAEALAEGDPDIAPQAVAEDGVDGMGLVEGRWGLGQEVPESLADVDEESRTGRVDVGPEGPGREARSDEEGVASLWAPVLAGAV